MNSSSQKGWHGKSHLTLLSPNPDCGSEGITVHKHSVSDPDPAFKVDTDPDPAKEDNTDPDPSLFMTNIQQK